MLTIVKDYFIPLTRHLPYMTAKKPSALLSLTRLLNRLGLRGVSVTAPGDKADFVSRFFAPKFGIPEDPVTGSAHCELAPYRADRLNKNILKAVQVSKRGGEILCRVEKEKGRVIISGRAATFMEGGDLSAAVKGGYCFSILNPIFPDLFFRRGH